MTRNRDRLAPSHIHRRSKHELRQSTRALNLFLDRQAATCDYVVCELILAAVAPSPCTAGNPVAVRHYGLNLEGSRCTRPTREPRAPRSVCCVRRCATSSPRHFFSPRPDVVCPETQSSQIPNQREKCQRHWRGLAWAGKRLA